MKNAIVYAVNNNPIFISCMVNSINSIYANNSHELLETIDLYILTTYQNIKLTQLNLIAKPNIVMVDYTKIIHDEIKKHASFKRFSEGTLLRFELFGNKTFHKYDNILYLDCDTVVNGDISELFEKKDKPQIQRNPGYKSACTSLDLYDVENLQYYCNAGVFLINPSAFDENIL